MDEATAALDEAEVKRLFDVIHRRQRPALSRLRLPPPREVLVPRTVRPSSRTGGSRRASATAPSPARTSSARSSGGDRIRVSRRRPATRRCDHRGPGDLDEEHREPGANRSAGEVVGLGGFVGPGRSEVLGSLRPRRGAEGRDPVSGRQVTLSSIRRAMTSRIALVPEDRRSQGITPKRSVERTPPSRGLAWPWPRWRRERKRSRSA